jgi:hypothetical protein
MMDWSIRSGSAESLTADEFGLSRPLSLAFIRKRYADLSRVFNGPASKVACAVAATAK